MSKHIIKISRNDMYDAYSKSKSKDDMLKIINEKSQVIEVLRFHVIEEDNEWEGETWTYYILDNEEISDDIEEALIEACSRGEFEFNYDYLGIVEIQYDDAATISRICKRGYMKEKRFFKNFDIDGFIKELSGDDGDCEDILYKCGIRKFCDEMFLLREA